MSHHRPSVAFCVFLLLIPLSFGQPANPLPPRPEVLPAEQAPAAVTEALRARVNEFFQYHVEHGSALRKAMEMVAEDTKDEYFAAEKMKIQTFEVSGVKYAPGFEKAMVTLDVTREWNFFAQTKGDIVTIPMVTYWKIEEGEWRWYKEKSMESITPMGLSNLATMDKPELLKEDENGNINLPADFNKPETLLAQARLILGQSKIDKGVVTLSLDALSEDTVRFENGYGDVNMELYGVPDIPGLTASVEKTALRAGENGVVHFRYDPAAAEKAIQEAKDAGQPVPGRIPPSFNANILISPFNQMFSVRVNLNRAESAQ